MATRTSIKFEVTVIFIIAFLAFAMPSLLRWQYYGNPTIIGFPTYMQQRQAQELLNGSTYDHLSFGGRPFTYPPLFSYTLAAFGLLLSIQIAGLIFVSLFGALGVVFFYLIVYEHFIIRHENYKSASEKKRKKIKLYALLASLLLVLIPGTIYFSAHLSTRSPPLTLGLAAIYFLMKPGKNRYIVIAGIFLGIAALYHPETAAFFMLVALFLARQNKKIFLSFVLAIAIASAYYVPFLLQNGVPQFNALHEEYITRGYSLESFNLRQLFFELTPDGYLTIAMVLLAIVGYAEQKDKFLAYWALIALALGFAAERFFIYMAVPIAFLAVYALLYMENKKWFRTALAIILVYSFLLAASKVTYFAQSYPTAEQNNAMLWIKNNTPANATVLSDWQWGHWIAGISERKNFVDGYAEYAPDATKRINELNNFYATCQVPQGYGIGYVYMEKWFIDQQNITCLGKFQLLYNHSTLLVYKV